MLHQQIFRAHFVRCSNRQRLIANTTAGVSYPNSFSKLSKDRTYQNISSDNASKTGVHRGRRINLLQTRADESASVNGKRQLALISIAFHGPPAI